MAATKAPNIDNLSAKENEAQKVTGFPQPGTADTGGYSLVFVACASSLTATAGSGTLPATPSGFFEAISPAGNLVKIPYYDA
jgi:hypothetical protein